MSTHIRSAWSKTLLHLAGMLGVGLLIGSIIGHVWMCLCCVCAGILSWNYWRLHRVLKELTCRRWVAPRGRGAWNELDRLLHRSQTDMRARKRRLIGMLRTYSAAAAALPDALVVIDQKQQRVQWFNHAAEELLGLSHPTDLQISIVERLQPLPIAHWLTSGRNAEPLLDVKSPVNPQMQLNLRLIPYSDEYWLLIARDVSKLLRLEQMRRDFVANVSHELRTPLTVVHGYLDVLDPEDFKDSGPLLIEMRKQSQRMTQLVEDLLMLSRLESQERLCEEHVCMTSMLLALEREAKAYSQGRHEIQIINEAECNLLGSTRELHSAFSNLVTNAVRYTPAGGKIKIVFARKGRGVFLRVSDTGYGIAAKHIPRLTERFYRVSSSRSRETGGTGLGLSIVKHVLSLHKARLDIRSMVGKGSEFTCYFAGSHIITRRTDPTDSVS